MAPKPANHMSLEAVLCKGSLLEDLACADLDAGLAPVLLDALVAMKIPYFWGGFGKTSL
jgi:hypothetical protein